MNNKLFLNFINKLFKRKNCAELFFYAVFSFLYFKFYGFKPFVRGKNTTISLVPVNFHVKSHFHHIKFSYTFFSWNNCSHISFFNLCKKRNGWAKLRRFKKSAWASLCSLPWTRKSVRTMSANCSSTEYEKDSNKTIFVIFILY